MYLLVSMTSVARSRTWSIDKLFFVCYADVKHLVYAAATSDRHYLVFKYPVTYQVCCTRTRLNGWRSDAVPTVALVLFGVKPKRGRKKGPVCSTVAEYRHSHQMKVAAGIVQCSVCDAKIKAGTSSLSVAEVLTLLRDARDQRMVDDYESSLPKKSRRSRRPKVSRLDDVPEIDYCRCASGLPAGECCNRY